jgi:23S rRNA (cytidine1920-2'-O)/16S rRNA (cytidine1409-2'-O)-methyltransferase
VRRRLDAEMVRRGLVVSRARAAEAIRAGLVTVQGHPAAKAATLVTGDVPISLDEPTHAYVSRGGRKLEAALDRFGVDPSGRDCLDAGASTGGFTDCLLRGGAVRVVAVDVGYGQLAWELREDPRVHVMERTNVRDLRPEALPFVPDLVVADLSFISLRTVLPALASVAGADAEFVTLVKPQFEAGPGDVSRGGVVRDPQAWRRSVEGVAATCADLGIGPLQAMPSPVLGPAGNVEFLLHARVGRPARDLALDDVLREAAALRVAAS